MSLLANWKVAPPFGQYWLLVDSVTFHKSGFDLRVRVLRSRDLDISAGCSKCSSKTDTSVDASSTELNVSEVAANLQVRHCMSRILF